MKATICIPMNPPFKVRNGCPTDHESFITANGVVTFALPLETKGALIVIETKLEDRSKTALLSVESTIQKGRGVFPWFQPQPKEIGVPEEILLETLRPCFMTSLLESSYCETPHIIGVAKGAYTLNVTIALLDVGDHDVYEKQGMAKTKFGTWLGSEKVASVVDKNLGVLYVPKCLENGSPTFPKNLGTAPPKGLETMPLDKRLVLDLLKTGGYGLSPAELIPPPPKRRAIKLD